MKLILFDVDGTLTEPRKSILDPMLTTLKQLKKIDNLILGIVGGSNLEKQQQQLGDAIQLFDYIFSENGLVSFENGKLFHRRSIAEHLGEKNLQLFLNSALHKLSLIELPIKRGTFIEFRSGIINISPIGRDCNYQERLDFNKYDLQHGIRKKLIQELQHQFSHLNLNYSLGGQISIDIFPIGWDKTYCLQHIENKNFTQIHFFGDKTLKDGNDYEIYNSPKVIGHAVNSPNDTIRICQALFLSP